MTAQGKQNADWGRVADDGTVYVRIRDVERVVGQYPAGSPEEALTFFGRRYDAIAFEVHLLEQRVRAGALSPAEARQSVKLVAEQLENPNFVGDLAALSARLDALGPLIGVQRERRREEEANRLKQAEERKAAVVVEAQKLAQGRDWRGGANRLRDLLEEWKALPRLDKRTDDELWHRFSAARTAYTKARKAHFAEQSERRDAAKVVKQRLVREAESLAGSTEWGSTSSRFRTLTQQWKAAGPAPKDVEEELWQRFRGAQDTFFGSREEANAAQDKELAANAETKKALLVEAEALDPRADLEATRRTFRDIADRWEAAGDVPPGERKVLESRIRRVEQSIRTVEDDRWRRRNPEVRARAADTVAKLLSSIANLRADLERAESSGDQRKANEHRAALEARQSWLDQAQRALDDTS
ncbi:MAG: DUF349 domain-containing protein [Actinomycetota bacterium]|nr:DUF349 domain-containing protein [Actinomycetota bacterium]MDQ6935343.1 DUF349 domain-containing protein [Actinomycetota bacterium]